MLNYIAAKSDSKSRVLWLPLLVHASDTEYIIKRLFNSWLSDAERNHISSALFDTDDTDKACNYCRLIAMLHDIGKITPAFQSKITHNIEGHAEKLKKCGLDMENISEVQRSPHNLAGCVILKNFGFSEETAVIVGLHHGSMDLDTEYQLERYSENYYGIHNAQKEKWIALRRELVDHAMEHTGFYSAEDLPSPDVKCQMLITGLLIMSDWIASNTEYFPLIDTETDHLTEEELKIRGKKAWEKLSLPSFWCAGNLDFKDRFGFDPNGVQSDITDIVSNVSNAGIYILEAPMGLGKTEAALASAEVLANRFGSGGIYFGLPTQATANGVFGRIRDWVSKCSDDPQAIRLAHGMTELNEEYQSLFRGKASDVYDESNDKILVHEWFEGGKQALLADFVIATVDQFLLASLKQKHVMLRHLGLAGKVVIIDECHAYDAYMNVYLDKTLAWMGAYGVPVIILSATLPPKRRNELIQAYLNKTKPIPLDESQNPLAYPALTWTDGESVHTKALKNDTPDKTIIMDKVNEDDLADNIAEKLNGGGCAAVIVNTVAYAVKIARMLEDKLKGFKIICFHSRFTATDRADTERKLLKIVGKNSKPEERDKLIVVGTQVIEQSLDLDFDYMVTQLCPIDLLLQRSGRLHRHNRQRPDRVKTPVLTVLKTNEDNSDKIYSEWILMQTEKYLPDKLVIPSCIPKLVSEVYADAEGEEAEGKEWKEYLKRIGDKTEAAKTYCIKSNLLNSKRTKYLDRLLDDNVGNGAKAEASVRDSQETPEVLVLQKKSDGTICFLPWYNGGAVLDTTQILSKAEEIAAARERIRLPMWFGKYSNFDKTLDELDPVFPRWRDNRMLNKELLLLLDDDLETKLLGKTLKYSREYGLEVINKEG